LEIALADFISGQIILRGFVLPFVSLSHGYPYLSAAAAAAAAAAIAGCLRRD